MEKFDTIDLEIIPKKKIEHYGSYPKSDGCAFVINGKKVLDLINENDSSAIYSYMTAKDLYYEMTEPWCYEDDAIEYAYYPILCCMCGETGCASIGVRIKRYNDVVEWYDVSHISACTDIGTKIGNFTFRFKANEYDAVMQKLKKLVNNA